MKQLTKFLEGIIGTYIIRKPVTKFLSVVNFFDISNADIIQLRE